MECRYYHEPFKHIKDYWQECRYVIYFMNFCFEFSDHLHLLPFVFAPLFFYILDEKTVYCTEELYLLNNLCVNVSLKKHCFILFIARRPVHDRDEP